MDTHGDHPGPPPVSHAIRKNDQPMFYAALAFSAGVLAAAWAWRPDTWWLIAAVSALVATAFFLRSRPAWALALSLGAFFSLGALHLDLYRASRAPLPDLTHYTRGEEVLVTGHVVRSSLPRSQFAGEAREQRQVLDIATEEIGHQGASQPIVIGLRLSVYATLPAEPETEADDSESGPAPADVPQLKYGQRIRFPVRLRLPRNYGNAGAMDYREYLNARGIVALGAVKSAKVERLPGFAGTRLGLLRSEWRSSLLERVAALAPMEKSQGWSTLDEQDVGLLAAMVLGEQSLIPRDTRAEFQRTGAFHILVVSGMNVGILAFVVFFVARRLRASEILATLITIVMSLLYAFVTDLGTPVLRATLMLALYLTARLIYRDRFSLNSIGTAALLVLLAAPDAVMDASFQLTFLSVVALSAIAQPLIERTSQPYSSALYGLHLTAYDAALAPKLAQWRLDLRLIGGRLARFLPFHLLSGRLPERFSPESWDLRLATWLLTSSLRAVLMAYSLLVVTSVMQLALALPMTIYFHRLALLGLPTNLVVVPLTGVLMPAAIAATLLSYVSSTLATGVASIAALALHGITFTVENLGGLRFADLRLAVPEMVVLLFAAAAFAFAVFAVRKGRVICAAALTGLVAASVLLALPPKPRLAAGVAEVTVIDVGQGDAILVVSPDGHTLLVDGGGPAGYVRSETFDVGEDVVSPYLWARGISRLDAVALSHSHSDHLFGLRSVMANFRPRELWLGRDSDSASHRRLLDQAASQGMRVVPRRAGEEFAFGLLQVRVLAPELTPVGATERERKNESLVLEVRYGNTAALLSGDAEKTSERAIAVRAQDIDLLKVAHHGSATSTTETLLAAARPEWAVISVGYRNTYGHPKREVLERLQSAGIRTFRTDTHGAVRFLLDGKRVTVQASRPQDQAGGSSGSSDNISVSAVER